LVHQAVDELLAVGAVRVRREVLALDVGVLLLGLGQALVGRVVEAEVAPAADVEDQADLLGLPTATAATGAVVVPPARCGDESECQQGGRRPRQPPSPAAPGTPRLAHLPPVPSWSRGSDRLLGSHRAGLSIAAPSGVHNCAATTRVGAVGVRGLRTLPRCAGYCCSSRSSCSATSPSRPRS